MFTGIVQGTAPIVEFDLEPEDHARLVVELPDAMRQSLSLGDSVSIDGVCLTVCAIDAPRVAFDVIKSTLGRTIVGRYQVGTAVNVERSLTLESEIGGHEVSGHVDLVATVERVESTPNNRCLFFRIAPEWGRYVFPRGFVALNGCSLTISDCLEGGSLFSVWLIPETLRLTNLGDLQAGDGVNMELHRGVQVVVDTIEASVRSFLQDVIEGEGTADEIASKLGALQERFFPKLMGEQGGKGAPTRE